MSIYKIQQALPGERVVAQSPEDAASAATDWLRRPNLFPGRALTTPALEQRQRWQAGRIAQRGQAYTPGVVRGMEVSHPVEADGNDSSPLRVLIEPGLGLAVSGEDVVLARRVEFLLSDLPVVAPPSVFSGLLDADAQQAAEVSAMEDADPLPGAPLPRAIGPTLGEILTHAPESLPSIGIVLLQPVTVDTADLDPDDPCDRCPCDEGNGAGADPASFEDWRTADGVRLLWYPWPEEWRPLPYTQIRRRNALAHVIFEAEAMLLHGECLPWEQYGVPTALIAISDTLQIDYIDRAAVVRQGGRAREARLQLVNASVAALAANSRLPALWQARIEQFAGQIAEMGEPLPAPEVLADPFLHLPPCGLLPTSALRLDDLDKLRSDFFPPLFALDAVPVPLEQLDLAVREAAPMAALDLGVPERVRLLVPVSQASWEPRLLLEDAIDKAFKETLERFLLNRARALASRQGLRRKAALLAHALDGQLHGVTDFDQDPLAVEPETLTPWGPPPDGAPPDGGGHRSSLQARIHEHYFDGASIRFPIAEGDLLFIWVYLDPDNPPRTLMLQWHTAAGDWEQRAYFGENLIEFGTPDTPSRLHAGELPSPGAWTLLTVPAAKVGLAGVEVDGMAFSLFDGRAAFGETGALTKEEQRNWFSNFIPPDARVQGNEPWDLLTHNDLWSPFERDDGVVASLPESEITGGGDPLAGDATQAELAIPKSGFSIYYPLNSAWRGHVITFPDTATAPVFPQKAGSDTLSTWVYLDELTPPRAIWAYLVCVGLNASNSPAGGSVLRLAFWGENRLTELNAFVPGMKNFEAQTLRAGALPQAGVWTRLTLPQPDGSEIADATKLRVVGMLFLTFGGAMAYSDASIDPPASGGASIPVWPLSSAEGKPTPPFMPYKNSQAELQTALDVLAPTPSSHIGTVRIYTELVNDPMLARLSFHERSQLQLRGLRGYADYLRVRIDRADDITDFGFAHMQVDLHRIRQMMMSTTDASRIAISPALAAIAKSDSAITVQAQIKDYLAGVKMKPATKAVGAAIGAAAAASFTAAPKSTGTSTAGSGFSNAQTVKASAQASLIRTPRAPLNIVYSRPVIGLSEVRTTAIAERLRQPPSTEARDYALANRKQTVSSLLDLLNAFVTEDSGEVPALFQDFDIFGLEGDPFLEGILPPKRKLADFRANEALLGLLLQPPTLESAVDEGSLFTQTAALSDNTVAILRQLEGRLTIYRDALTRCERAMDDLQISIDAVSQRVQQVEDTLAEARHDVGVARALMAEEQARIDAVNARRRKVLDEEVKFLAYVRPRETSKVLTAPHRVIDPALAEAPLPACLRDHHDVPDELEDMLRVVREAPASWFIQVPKLLDKLDRSDLLLRTVKSAQRRMPQLSTRKPVAAPVAGKLGNAISNMLTRQSRLLTTRLEAASRVDLELLARGSWQNLRNQAQDIVSLGDIIDGEHGKSALTRQAADEFDRIGAVCSCLHAEFCGVPALIRLDWAETLSQFDDAPNLRNLGSLSRWSEIDSTDRRQMQAYVDWLFAQIEPKQVQGVALMNDVIRMCLLLASHAPVGRIIVGRIPRPITAVRPGTRIPLLALDPGKLRIGMQAI
ncbi:MAG: hypothetical protein IH606_00650, partial [Burkholderiales bacterium]|nr:hypothetical protein [Burkholderiales bacterium]